MNIGDESGIMKIEGKDESMSFWEWLGEIVTKVSCHHSWEVVYKDSPGAEAWREILNASGDNNYSLSSLDVEPGLFSMVIIMQCSKCGKLKVIRG